MEGVKITLQSGYLRTVTLFIRKVSAMLFILNQLTIRNRLEPYHGIASDGLLYCLHIPMF